MPAAEIQMRFHLLGRSQLSVTSQYSAGVRTRKSIPISWTSPPKCLAVRPWPNSWMTLTIARLHQK